MGAQRDRDEIVGSQKYCKDQITPQGRHVWRPNGQDQSIVILLRSGEVALVAQRTPRLQTDSSAIRPIEAVF